MGSQDNINMEEKNNIRTVIEISIMVSIGIIIQIIEAPIPRPMPWAKIGMANVVTVLSLSLFGLREAVFITFLRILMVSLLIGTFLSPGFFLSMSGGLVSTFIMGLVLILFSRHFSLIGVSLIGALAHNLTQLAAAYFIFFKQLNISLDNVLYLTLMMLVWSLPTGIFVGYTAKKAVPVFVNTRKRLKW